MLSASSTAKSILCLYVCKGWGCFSLACRQSSTCVQTPGRHEDVAAVPGWGCETCDSWKSLLSAGRAEAAKAWQHAGGWRECSWLLHSVLFSGVFSLFFLFFPSPFALLLSTEASDWVCSGRRQWELTHPQPGQETLQPPSPASAQSGPGPCQWVYPHGCELNDSKYLVALRAKAASVKSWECPYFCVVH